MADYTPWYWDWDDIGGTGSKKLEHGPQPCGKEFQPDDGTNTAPPKAGGLPWSPFTQMEWTDPDKQTPAPGCKPVQYWVRCKNLGCKKPYSCVRIDIMVQLPNGNYVNDLKFVCKDSAAVAGKQKTDSGKK